VMKDWSLFKLKERFIGEVAQEAVQRTARQWPRTLKQFKAVASCRHHDPSLLSYRHTGFGSMSKSRIRGHERCMKRKAFAMKAR
jgi:hypothetical protein